MDRLPVSSSPVQSIPPHARGLRLAHTGDSFPHQSPREALPEHFVALVHGDSMEPAYPDESFVLFSDTAKASDGDACFVQFENGNSTFKRISFERDAQGKDAIRLTPINQKYRSQVVRRDLVAWTMLAHFIVPAEVAN